MKNICIIPARGGSKRIPRKNIKDFLGKPILAYSIETALNSRLFDEVMVSTEDEEIATVSRKYGASVPFLRSAETANDFATTVDVLNEVLQMYKELGFEFDKMCCLYATAPLVKSKDIVQAFALLEQSVFDCVYPVVPFPYPIWRCLDVAADGSMQCHWPEFENCRSQDLPKEYHDTGTFYCYDLNKWHEKEKKNGAIIVDETCVQDIDTMTDWAIAEMKYKLLNG